MRAPFYCIPDLCKVSSRADVDDDDDEMGLKMVDPGFNLFFFWLLPLIPQPTVTHHQSVTVTYEHCVMTSLSAS